MDNDVSPCRLFVYLARDAPIGVVLRRGPSAWARLSLWHTDSDTFEHGQWMAARVYERRSDLSPDGSLFVAFVRGSSRDGNADSWIAVSRPPWFTALAFWPIGGTYCTGGFFRSDRTLWLPVGPEVPEGGGLPHCLSIESGPDAYIERGGNWTERTVHLNRLLRDGWARVDGARLETWAHPNPLGTMTLLMTEHSDRDFRAFGGPHVVEYAVLVKALDDMIPFGRATWADWDQQGRLVIARNGRLFSWDSSGYIDEIADFNGQTPDPQPPPEWALTWPTRAG
jgi:hypothetical protein